MGGIAIAQQRGPVEQVLEGCSKEFETYCFYESWLPFSAYTPPDMPPFGEDVQEYAYSASCSF